MVQQVEIFKALGDETRLKIVRCLLTQEYCACEFTFDIQKDQTTISRHLKILVDAGILKSQKNGRNIIYSIKDKATIDMLINFGIEGIPCCEEGKL
ncbi:MAG: DNA-binding transcriptional repressor ArsR [Candidatus Methanofastidiosum methylothiophilum]|uniref:DNA-binding transcriptional repressor ArsR n=1 Tax=Candidatus Methanofastidiosum methylothiophilum TaxID=1705564 RepID=A0A150ILI4_9EURY|nr:MAG: DNA-binding transcriptional repressor ArsR [Candidatus Methanofastidiosum methylthiophilus]KYC48380.1 MAG: DNA-binding transcriptional repressor ArsR [Candidatus Methanofastidiosum methylthiophilus]KYC50755.1 MAG: DNA-binding transcriptional repressor ArsR [Candidatus Methanofastidiosum methylthiophilus]